MSSIDDYLTTVTPAQKTEFERIRALVHRIVPTVEEGISYAMPAYLYKGKAFLSAMAYQHFLSIYPFSGKVVDVLRDKLGDYELTPGSIHFSETRPISETLLKEIISTRLQEIEKRLQA